jgi:hypothetical protein
VRDGREHVEWEKQISVNLSKILDVADILLWRLLHLETARRVHSMPEHLHPTIQPTSTPTHSLSTNLPTPHAGKATRLPVIVSCKRRQPPLTDRRTFQADDEFKHVSAQAHGLETFSTALSARPPSRRQGLLTLVDCLKSWWTHEVALLVSVCDKGIAGDECH